MKTHTKLSMLLAAAALSLTSNLQAQSLLQVDLNDGGASPAGFSVWDLSGVGVGPGTSLATTTFGSINLSLSASLNSSAANAPALDGSGNLVAWDNNVISRARGAIGTTSYGSMYQDFVTAAAGGAIGLQISGLSADTAYAITFYSFDENGSRTSNFFDHTGGADNALGSITYSNPGFAGSGNPTSDSQYSLTSIVTTDASGRLTFTENEAGNAPVLDGFAISAVPEPGPLSLLSAGLVTLVGVSRFRGQGRRVGA